MGKYLYNGICLPALPAYDFSVYPNAYIYRKKAGPEYILTVTESTPKYRKLYEPYSGLDGYYVFHTGKAKSYTLSGEVWLPGSEIDWGYTMHSIPDGDVFWTNVDIPLDYRDLDTVTGYYLTASEPVPPLPRSCFKLGLAFGLCGKPLSFVKGGGVGE